MTATPPPFRTCLRPFPGEMDLESLGLYDRVLGGKSTPDPLEACEFARVRESGNEMLLYALLVRGQGAPRPEQRREWALLLQHCLAEAEAEGVLWNPLLDRLVEAMGWSRYWVEKGSEGLPPSLRSLPSPEEQVERLIPWIEAQTELRALAPLLDFRYGEIHKRVAGHARVLDQLASHSHELSDSQLGLLLEHAETMGRNPELSDQALQRLAYRSLEVWEKEAAPERGLRRGRSSRWQTGVLYAAAERGVLGPETQQRLLHFRSGETLSSAEPFAILLADRTCPPEILRRVALAGQRRVPEAALVRVLGPLFFHPNAPESLLRRLAGMERGGEAIREHRGSGSRWSRLTPREMLLLLDIFPQDADIAAALVQGGEEVPEVWIRAASLHRTREVLQPLADKPRARVVPEVRRVLLQARSKHVLVPLFQEAAGEEYALLVARLMEMDLALARATLRSCPPPAGTRLPPELMARLLAGGTQGERLSLIRMMGEEVASPAEPRRR